MTVTIELFGGTDPGGKRRLQLELEGQVTIKEALRAAGVPWGSHSLVVMNGKSVSAARLLEEGDIVQVFPPVDGG